MRLSELIAAARRELKAITNRGRAGVAVLARRELDRLVHPREPLTDFFARSGLDEVEIDRVEAEPRGAAKAT